MTKCVTNTHTAEKDDSRRDDGRLTGTKVLRLPYFFGAGFIYTATIDKWRELERKSLKKKQQESNLWTDDNSATTLQMGTLQSRLDAEFLLAHMCSVKFKN